MDRCRRDRDVGGTEGCRRDRGRQSCSAQRGPWPWSQQTPRRRPPTAWWSSCQRSAKAAHGGRRSTHSITAKHHHNPPKATHSRAHYNPHPPTPRCYFRPTMRPTPARPGCPLYRIPSSSRPARTRSFISRSFTMKLATRDLSGAANCSGASSARWPSVVRGVISCSRLPGSRPLCRGFRRGGGWGR